jgi:hypothetical protein
MPIKANVGVTQPVNQVKKLVHGSNGKINEVFPKHLVMPVPSIYSCQYYIRAHVIFLPQNRGPIC